MYTLWLINQLCYNSRNPLRWFSVFSSHMLSLVGIYIPLAGPQAACPAYWPRHYILLDLVNTQASANTVIFLCFDYTDCCCAMCPFKSSGVVSHTLSFKILMPRQNGRHFPDDIFLNENVWISINISLKFVPRGPINNIPTLAQVMAWCRPGDKPVSEPLMVRLPTHICVTRPQWVNLQSPVFLLALYNRTNLQFSGICFVTADGGGNAKNIIPSNS